MPNRERLRDIVFGTLDPDLVRKREEQGWRLTGVEWERPGGSATPTDFIEPPYGYRVASDCRHLEADPIEAEILRRIMQGVVNDRPLSFIAADLNEHGYQTRGGDSWNPAKVFRLMPALVEAGPRIFSESEWPTRRHELKAS